MDKGIRLLKALNLDKALQSNGGRAWIGRAMTRGRASGFWRGRILTAVFSSNEIDGRLAPAGFNQYRGARVDGKNAIAGLSSNVFSMSASGY